MDKLEHIFQLQASFDEDLARRRKLAFSQREWILREVLAIVAELGELLEAASFKWWKDEQPMDREAVRGELVDILHFFTAACLKAGISAEELYQGYLAKNAENFRRQDGATDRAGYRSG